MKPILILLISSYASLQLAASPTQLGAGSFSTKTPNEVTPPPEKIYRTKSLKGPVPTNDWWSSVLWEKFSSNHYPHPLAVKCEMNGLRIFYPGPKSSASDRAFIAGMPNSINDLIIGTENRTPFKQALVQDYNDWFLTVQFGTDDTHLRCTYGHGSPFVYIKYKKINPSFIFQSTPKIWSLSESSIGITTVTGNHYGIFSPRPTKWKGLKSRTFQQIENGDEYLSVAVLPDNEISTLNLFANHAHAHITDTKITWEYDTKSSKVIAKFNLKTVSRNGEKQTPLTSLYPHQWRRTEKNNLLIGPDNTNPFEYESVRGKMKLFKGNSFEVHYDFPGILPCLPFPVDGLKTGLAGLASKKDIPRDTYWGGKFLGNLATGSAIADTCGHKETSIAIRKRIKTELQDWFVANGKPNDRHFHYNSNWGSMIGIPPSYGSSKELNDHHFHYGYFFRAAAEITRTEPEWLTTQSWHQMLRSLIDDVACDSRNNLKYPFLRNFDPYAGHSWASGHARFADGNNQESSSESMNAWTGMILLGEFTKNKRLRDLGIYLFSSELASIEEYWFDISNENHPKSLKSPSVAMVWGGKSTYETWFSNEPHCKTGINLLPIHGGSIYLGRHPDYVGKNYQYALHESGGTWKGWPSIMLSYQALSNAEKAWSDWKRIENSLTLDSGNFKANAVHWIQNLRQLGQVQRHIKCDYPIAATFKSSKNKLHHVVYAGGKDPVKVHFSDGVSFIASPGKFTVK
ncbi:MAG: glycosyl hydrolase [Verrucomicrobiota bacterium]|nr:glycosyl hydrolase [Verrucomicrobiota bacterium]